MNYEFTHIVNSKVELMLEILTVSLDSFPVHLVNIPCGKIRSTERKPETFGRTLTDSFHIKMMNESNPLSPS
jgi:hypothetical protein